MRNLYSKLTTKSFRYLSTIFFIIGDLGISYYFYSTIKSEVSKIFGTPIFKEKLNQSMSKQGIELPEGMENNLIEIFFQSLMLFFAMAITLHIIVYVFYLYEKRFAYLYLRCLSFMGGIFSLFYFLSKVISSPLMGVGFLILLVGYLFIFSGFYYYPVKPKQSLE